MLFTGWLRRLGVSAWSRLRLRRDDGVGISPVLDPAGVTVKVFPQAVPDPVRWGQVAFVARVEPVQAFQFDRQPLGSASGTPASPDDLPPLNPGDPAQENLLTRLWRVLALPWSPLLPGPGSVVEWPGELMPFQLEGVRALLESRRMLLADDMGLGKTLQVIVALLGPVPERRN